MLAAYKNPLNVVQFLLKNGADQSIKDIDGKTALDIAISKNFTKIIDVLKQWMEAIFYLFVVKYLGWVLVISMISIDESQQ